MKLKALGLFLIMMFTITSHAALKIGEAAPMFSLPSANGETVSLAALLAENKAKHLKRFIVLEWFNNECPYVKKHYNSGNMQALQTEYTKKGVSWFTIASSSPGSQGHLTAAQASDVRKSRKAASEFLLDEKGTVGHLYDAKTTPHMFIIDPNGKLVYQGAIDDQPTTEIESIKTVKDNYVKLALNELLAGKDTVTIPSKKPYGCSVKY